MPPASTQATGLSKDVQADIDEFGDLDLTLQHMAPAVARHAVLKEKIVGLSKEMNGERPCVFEAPRWTVQFMPRENRRTIFDPRKAFAALKKIIGMDAAIALVDVPLGAAIDKFIPEDKHKLFVSKERTGPRSMKVIPTHEPPKAA